MQRNTRTQLAAAVVALSTLHGMASAARVYVKAGSAPGGNGNTWGAAYADLQTALDRMRAQPGTIDEIWMAAGTYRPDRGTGDRIAKFTFDYPVAMYGGFAGTETQLDQRDPAVNRTILSGDLLMNDGPNFTNRGDNSICIVGVATELPTRIDGFVLRGNNSSMQTFAARGAISGSQGTNVVNCIVEDCTSNGINPSVLFGSGATFEDCVIRGNTGPASVGTATFRRCTFETNTGQVHTNTVAVMTALFEDCLFRANVPPTNTPLVGTGSSSMAGTLRFTRCQFLETGTVKQVISSTDEIVLTVMDCLFADTIGVVIAAQNATITGSTFRGTRNETAVRLSGSLPILIESCIFEDNQNLLPSSMNASGVGALVVGRDGTNVAAQIRNCIFRNNASAADSSTMLIPQGGVEIHGCTFADNVGADGTDVHVRSGTLFGLDPLGLDAAVRAAGNVSPGLPSQAIGGFAIGPATFAQSATLQIDVAGLTPGVTHDQLVVNGTANIPGGGLHIAVAPGFEIAEGDSIVVLTADAITGSGFDLVSSSGLPAGQFFEIETTETAVRATLRSIEAFSGLAPPVNMLLPTSVLSRALGDLNGDGYPELLVSVRPQVSGGPSAIMTFRNRGVDANGLWLGYTPLQTVSVPPQGGSAGTLLIGKFDGDSTVDVVSQDGRVFWCLSNPGGDGFLYLGRRTDFTIPGSEPLDLTTPDFSGEPILNYTADVLPGTTGLDVGTSLGSGGPTPTFGARLVAGPGLVNNGKGFEFSFPSIGYHPTACTFAMRRVGSGGFTHWSAYVRTNGGPLPISEPALLNDEWTAYTVNLPEQVANQHRAYVGILLTGATSADEGVVATNFVARGTLPDDELEVTLGGCGFRNVGNGISWRSPALVPSTSGAQDLFASVTSTTNGGAHRLLNDGAGFFGLGPTMRDDTGSALILTSPQIVDWSGDGFPDVVGLRLNSSLRCSPWLPETNTFAWATHADTPGLSRVLCVGDIDRDARLDAITVGDAPLLGVARGSEAGGFLASQVARLAAPSTALAVADIDSDGDLDFIVRTASTQSQPVAIRYTRNDSTGGLLRLPNSTTIASAGTPQDLLVGDVNFDGNADVLVFTTFDAVVETDILATHLNTRPLRCPADLDNDGDFSNGQGRDEAVDINDLIYFLTAFELGHPTADLDSDGNPATGTPDGGVTIDDLLFFLLRFETGC